MSVLDTIDRIVNDVTIRLRRATDALSKAGIDYAVVGGNAVSAWIATADKDLIRFTRDVDVLIRREDLDRVRAALEPAGFIHRRVAGVDVFLDGPKGRVGGGIHVIFAGEFVKSGEPVPNPSVERVRVLDEGYPVLDLEALVQIKLTAFRPKDQAHIVDFLNARLVDESWIERLPPTLAERLSSLLHFRSVLEGHYEDDGLGDEE